MATIPMLPPGETLLTRAAATWLVVAFLGQWAFSFYIAALYSPAGCSRSRS